MMEKYFLHQEKLSWKHFYLLGNCRLTPQRGPFSKREECILWGTFPALGLPSHLPKAPCGASLQCVIDVTPGPSCPWQLPRVLEAGSSPCLPFRGSVINNSSRHAILTAATRKETPEAAMGMTTKETKKTKGRAGKTIQRRWLLQKSASWLFRDGDRDKIQAGLRRADPHISSGLKRWKWLHLSINTWMWHLGTWFSVALTELG